MHAKSGLFGLLVFVVSAANAQSWSDEQLEIWNLIIESYEEIEAGDAGWSDRWLFPDALGWGPDYPMPRSRDSIKRWDAYQFAGRKTHLAEYSLVGIVVRGSTAVAHYYTSTASEDRDGKHTTTHGRCTDVMAKDGNTWKFIAWHCGDEPSEE